MWREKVDYTQDEWRKKNLEFLTNRFQEEARQLPPEIKQRATPIDGFCE
jgi:hypothetical protein